MVDAEQGRRKLPRGGAAIVRSIGGRAAADSVFFDYSTKLPRNCFRSISLH